VKQIWLLENTCMVTTVLPVNHKVPPLQSIHTCDCGCPCTCSCSAFKKAWPAAFSL
jgi:hypothetical protein